MKKLLLLVIPALLLMGCEKKYIVKLKSNGSYISAKDNHDRGFKKGDTVCVWIVSGGMSTIDNTGEMKDTTYVYSRYRIGIIQ